MNIIKLFMTMILSISILACVTGGASAGSYEQPFTVEELMAPPVEIALQDVNNGDVVYSSADHMGKPVLLDFYFASCPACQANAGNVDAATEEWHGDHGQVLQVSIDCEREEWDRWIRRYSITTPVLNDCARILAGRLGVQSYPTTIVLNPDHTIAYRFVGVWSQAARTRIRQLMAQ